VTFRAPRFSPRIEFGASGIRASGRLLTCRRCSLLPFPL
jgi:hypothetical protein